MRRLLLFLLPAVAWAAAPATSISDTLYDAFGHPVNGSINLSWTEFSYSGQLIASSPAAGVNYPISSGAVSLSLTPTDHSSAAGAYYKVVISTGGVATTAYWQVPTLPSGQCASSSYCKVSEVIVALYQGAVLSINPSQISVTGSSNGQALCNVGGIAGWGSCGGGVGGGGTWGSITGTLSSQADLQSALNAKEATANKDQNSGYAGLDSGGKLKLAEAPTWNQNTTGNAATATALAATPSQCSSGNYPLGVDVHGNVQNCTPGGGGGGSGTLTRSLGAGFTNGGSAIPTNMGFYQVAPFGCTINAWDLLVDSGTITFKVWKVASGTAIPTSANSINTNGISLSTGTAIHGTDLSDFSTTAIAQGDVLAFVVTAVSGPLQAMVQLDCVENIVGGGAGTWGTITGTLSDQTDLQSALNGKQASLGFTAENSANKDQNSGYAGLDSGGKLKTGEAPTWNQSTTGNAATATALAGSPGQCAAGHYPLGVDTGGNAQNCTSAGGTTRVDRIVFRSLSQNTVAGSNFSIPSANAPTAVSVEGANSGNPTSASSAWNFGTLSFAANSTAATAQSVQGAIYLSSNWSSTAGIPLNVTWRTAATSGAVVWQIQGQCLGSGAAPGSFGSASAVSASTAAGTTLQWTNASTLSMTTSDVLSGCSAGNWFLFRLFRDHQNGSDTLSSAAELVSAVFGVTQ